MYTLNQYVYPKTTISQKSKNLAPNLWENHWTKVATQRVLHQIKELGQKDLPWMVNSLPDLLWELANSLNVFKNPKTGGSYDFEIIKELEFRKLSNKKKKKTKLEVL